MATKILIKRSTTTGEVPTTSDLATGELGINTVDKRIFTNNSGTIVELGTTPSAQAVVGNASVGGTFDVVGQVTVDDFTATGTVNLTSATTSVAAPTADAHAATKLYVDTAVNDILDGAPAALDTLNEIAAAINDDANAFTTLTNSIATKLALAGGTMTGSIDMGANKVTSSATPTADNDLTRKGYVDTILGSATAAATSASEAATSASNAATSATAASGSATTASTQASSASTSATAASSSATSASTSATSASNSATSSATSATASASSATAAAQSATEAAASAASIDTDDFTVVDLTATGTVTLGAVALTATGTELNYVDGVTSSIQTQLDGKEAADADIVKKDVNNTFTAAQRGSTDTDTTNTGSVTLNFDTNQNFVLTLTGNVTLANPTTESVGQSGFIVFIQDGTGGRTVSLGTDYETAGGAGLTLSSTASTTDVVPYIVAASGRILLGTPQLAFA